MFATIETIAVLPKMTIRTMAILSQRTRRKHSRVLQRLVECDLRHTSQSYVRVLFRRRFVSPPVRKCAATTALLIPEFKLYLLLSWCLQLYKITLVCMNMHIGTRNQWLLMLTAKYKLATVTYRHICILWLVMFKVQTRIVLWIYNFEPSEIAEILIHYIYLLSFWMKTVWIQYRCYNQSKDRCHEFLAARRLSSRT